jgi:hypothetical protein
LSLNIEVFSLDEKFAHRAFRKAGKEALFTVLDALTAKKIK